MKTTRDDIRNIAIIDVYKRQVPIIAGHSLVSFCLNGCVLPWLERSMIASAPSFTAVSYTHLDVYKRQRLGNGP